MSTTHLGLPAERGEDGTQTRGTPRNGYLEMN
jgi:hypothetical protein